MKGPLLSFKTIFSQNAFTGFLERGLFAVLFVLLFAQLVPIGLNAQTGPQLSLEKIVGSSTAQTGENVTYSLRGGCSDLTMPCVGAVLTDTLPPNMEFVTAGPVFVESGSPPMLVNVPFDYDPVANTITWDFTFLQEAGMPAGSSFALDLVARIIPGTTPNGINVVNQAEFDSDDDNERVSAAILAEATPQWDLSKAVTSGPIYHDEDVTYRVTVDNTGGQIGNLNLQNVVITDQLPEGAVFVSASDGGGIATVNYDAGSNSVTWTLNDDLEVTTTTISFDVVVQYPYLDTGGMIVPENNTGLTTPIVKDNTVALTADPIGEPELTLTANADDPLLPPVFAAGVIKEAQDNASLPIGGATNIFAIGVSNPGTFRLDDFTVVDNIPDQFNLEYVVLDGFSGGTTVDVRVQIDGSTTWIPWLAMVSASGDLDLNGNPPPGFIPGTNYISAIEFDFGTVPPGFGGSIELSVSAAYDDSMGAAVDNAGNPVDLYTPYTNEATASGINPIDGSVVASTVSDEMCLIEQLARPAPTKAVVSNYVPGTEPAGLPTTGNPYYLGSRVTYTLHVENDGPDDNNAPYLTSATGYQPIENPIVTDLLPVGLNLDAGSFMLINNTSAAITSLPTPTITMLGTGETLIRWDFTGNLEVDESFDIVFNATIDNNAPIGTAVNSYCLSSATTALSCELPDCGETTASAAQGVTDACCAEVPINIVDRMAALAPEKDLTTAGPYAPEGSVLVENGLATSEVKYVLTFANDQMANFPIEDLPGIDFNGFDLLPAQLDYVDGSVVLVAGSAMNLDPGFDPAVGSPNVTFTATPDFNGTGRTLLEWEFDGEFPIGASVQYEITTQIRPGALGTVENWVAMNTTSFPYDCFDPSSPDNIPGLGDVCLAPGDPFVIPTVASLSANKFVRGANDGDTDDDFLRLPDIASTNDDDIVDWRLRIANPGNVPLTDVKVVDIFPYPGDVGVQLNTSQRGSAWRPFLVDQIRLPADLIGVATLSYSFSTNPCRPEIQPVSPGCVTGTWVEWPATLDLTPAELEMVQAIKIEWNDDGTGNGTTIPLTGGESYLIDIRMKSPVNNPPSMPSPVVTGTIAWNSLARNANEVPAQEPNKVGVRLDRMDLALAKTLGSGQSERVTPGDDVIFDITVTNQGSFNALEFDVTDYFPEEFTLSAAADPDWSVAVGPTSGFYSTTRTLVAGEELPADGLAPGESRTVQIVLTLDPTVGPGDYVNWAEISSDALDQFGVRRPDEDSTPDGMIFNQPGETDDLDDDNVINENGFEGGDEDDHDPALVTVEFDLALQKRFDSASPSATLPAGAPPRVIPGSTITYEIEVFNQGTFFADNIVVTDYYPTELTLNDPQTAPAWTTGAASGGGLNTASIDLSVANGRLPAGGLEPGGSVVVPITFDLAQDIDPATFDNFAEISSSTDILGVNQPDNDSTPDGDDTNDAGGGPDTPADDHVNGVAFDEDGNPTGGVPGDGVPATDEDDHDPARIETVFDLALRKRIAGMGMASYSPGDPVTFEIEVYNQGSYVADNIEITDYFPTPGLTLADVNWASSTPAGLPADYTAVTRTLRASNNDFNMPGEGLLPGESVIVTIDFTIDDMPNPTADSYTNFAEISDATDIVGVRRNDVDSTPDDDFNNDAGGEPGDPDTDNQIFQAPPADEDDHDPAQITLIFDLALNKVLAPGQPELVTPGDPVEYIIKVFNQGSYIADNIEITDFFPTELILNDPLGDWMIVTPAPANLPVGYTAVRRTLTAANSDFVGSMPNGSGMMGLLPGESIEIPISFTLDPNTLPGDFDNIAEISAATDDNGDMQPDIDSSPDDDPTNDPGGEAGTGSDDVITGNGMGGPGGTNPATDEDDQDPARVTAIFDLALRKELAMGQSRTVMLGDPLNFVITVFNQGTYFADNITVTDFYPPELILNDPLWNAGPTIGGLATVTRTVSVANGVLPPGGLAPGTFIELPISFQLDTDIPPSSEVNYAEISGATGINGALYPMKTVRRMPRWVTTMVVPRV
jgi:uncharacterized repeat protein (TIGR01451 family)